MRIRIFFVVFFLGFYTFGQSNNMFFPKIVSLNTKDVFFKQYLQDSQKNYTQLAIGKPISLTIYQYTTTETDDLLFLASRFNIPYETLALLNGLAFIDSPIKNKTLFIPSCPGIFLPKTPRSPLEFILKNRYPVGDGIVFFLEDKEFTFVAGGKLTPTERSFFLDSSMIPPLTKGIITSSYGIRINPFSGKKSFHNGIDIGAPEGTPVFACKSGILLKSGNDTVYGLYVIIQHDNNMQSIYGHLSEILPLNDKLIFKGEKIGEVGNTGLSTGPHLHFEIRVGGVPKNPSSLLKRIVQ